MKPRFAIPRYGCRSFCAGITSRVGGGLFVRMSIPCKTKLGDVFERLTVTAKDIEKSRKLKRTIWICVCECGNVITAHDQLLRTKRVRSCGCLLKDVMFARNFVHGLTYTPEHRSWTAMNNRCRNPNNDDYASYGGREITIDPRWTVFEQFLADMGPRPTLKHSLHRINNDGPYCKENCTWATAKEQARNRRNTHWVEYSGRKIALAEWKELHAKQ